MTIKIDDKIIGYEVVTDEQKEQAEKKPVKISAEIIRMTEQVQRPEGMDSLEGSTYKIKTPLVDHAMYVTINDIILNPGTDHELRRPFEVFINSKNMDQFQWVVALTRVISAVFRKGGDVTFLVEELKAVFDPQGGYFKKGGVFMPSIVAEIGCAIESHLKMIGMIEDETLTDHAKQILVDKRKEYEERNSQNTRAEAEADMGDFPEGSKLCAKCHTKAMILLDNCMTCLNCGNSKCG